MQRICLAPVLSATLSRDSCWITGNSCRRAGSRSREPCGTGLGLGLRGLLGLLEDLDDAPALGGRQRTGLHDEHEVAAASRVHLVVRLHLAGAPQDLAVQRVL